MTKKEDAISVNYQSLEVLKIDPWQQLKSFTRARIAIGRVGSSLPTSEVLDFGLSHATASDDKPSPITIKKSIGFIDLCCVSVVKLCSLNRRPQSGRSK